MPGGHCHGVVGTAPRSQSPSSRPGCQVHTLPHRSFAAPHIQQDFPAVSRETPHSLTWASGSGSGSAAVLPLGGDAALVLGPASCSALPFTGHGGRVTIWGPAVAYTGHLPEPGQASGTETEAGAAAGTASAFGELVSGQDIPSRRLPCPAQPQRQPGLKTMTWAPWDMLPESSEHLPVPRASPCRH